LDEQRDREFDLSDEIAKYVRRPSVWVRPVGTWGGRGGLITLVQLPSDSEVRTNVVAFGCRQCRSQPGQSGGIRYELHWTRFPIPARPTWDIVRATRIDGRWDVPQATPNPVRGVDFEGKAISVRCCQPMEKEIGVNLEDSEHVKVLTENLC